MYFFLITPLSRLSTHTCLLYHIPLFCLLRHSLHFGSSEAFHRQSPAKTAFRHVVATISVRIVCISRSFGVKALCVFQFFLVFLSGYYKEFEVHERLSECSRIPTSFTMPNVISRVSPANDVAAPDQRNPVLDIAMRHITSLSLEEQDLLLVFPTEVRLMIFEELLVVWPKVVFRGAHDFGPLDKKEFEEEIPIPWQILATCRKYYEEAMPIMYSKNKFVFCTGKGGEPGMFWRFPIHTRYMRYLTDLGIYLRADTPTKEAARRVAHFMRAITRLATNLENLVVLISSDFFYEKLCPWDIVFCDHPVAKALVHLVNAKTVKHLKIRLHDYAAFFPGFAQFLSQSFYKDGVPTDRSIVFSQSCTCPLACREPLLGAYCVYCRWLVIYRPQKPIDLLLGPAEVECSMEHMMDVQHRLFELGILPPMEEDGGSEENTGPYGGGPPIEDDYEEKRKAFHSGLLLPGQVRRYRGAVTAPAVWFYQQTKVTDYFKAVA